MVVDNSNILDNDFVFRWIHWSFIRSNDKIAPSGFNPHQGTISVFWERLISAKQALLLTKNPNDNGIGQIRVKDIRDYRPIRLQEKKRSK